METQLSKYPIMELKTRANPQPVYEQMRQHDPIYSDYGPMTGRRFWFFTRYDDCVAVLRDSRFGKNIEEHLTPEQLAQQPPQDEAFAITNRNMLFMDPPDHTRLRSLVHKAFTPRMIQNLEPRIQEITNDLLNAMEGKQTIDLIAEFALPLPSTVIAELLGVPLDDQPRFHRWTKTLLYSGLMEEAQIAALEFTMYIHEMIEERQENPREDLISGLVSVEEDGETLNREELISMIFLLLVAGHETTVNLIGNGTLALMQHRDQLDLLVQHPEHIKTAIEELLRFNGPVETTTMRWALEDVEIAGITIPQGDIVLPSLIAANRDPAKFENPNTLDITRDPNPHIAFGMGIHYCLGAPLARLEGAIAMNSFLQAYPNSELNTAVEDLQWSESLLLHGMKTLPIRLSG